MIIKVAVINNKKVTFKGEDIEMKPGVFIFMNKNAKHSLSAQENTSFLLALY